MSKSLLNHFYVAHAVFGFYGAFRGWNAKPLTKDMRMDETEELLTTKGTRALVNGISYALPVFNFVSVLNALDRLEIKLTGKDPYEYLSSYREPMLYEYYYIGS